MEKILREVKTWSFESEEDAKEFVEKVAREISGDITKHSIEKKIKKAKGEVIAECFQLIIQIDYEKIFDYLLDESDIVEKKRG